MSSAPHHTLRAANAIRSTSTLPSGTFSVKSFAANRSFCSTTQYQRSIQQRTCVSDLAHRSVRSPRSTDISREVRSQRIRSFSSSTPRCAPKTIQQAKARARGGPFNITAAILFIATGLGLWQYFMYEKDRMARQKIANETKGVGKPKVGGPFQLIDQDGLPFTSEDLKGKYSLVYFGFTHCPDICPDELDKMALMLDKVRENHGDTLIPVMITCDPARDTPAVLKEYLKEFHPDFVGLTGQYEMIKDTCKAYRVYFSTPPNVRPGQDYLVDHSIYFYLMDPDGDFVEAIGRNFTADQAAKVISDHIGDWSGPLNKKDRWA